MSFKADVFSISPWSEGLLLETLAFKPLTVTNLFYQLN